MTGLCAVKKLVLTTDNFKGGILYVICVKFMCPFVFARVVGTVVGRRARRAAGVMLPDTVAPSVSTKTGRTTTACVVKHCRHGNVAPAAAVAVSSRMVKQNHRHRR